MKSPSHEGTAQTSARWNLPLVLGAGLMLGALGYFAGRHSVASAGSGLAASGPAAAGARGSGAAEPAAAAGGTQSASDRRASSAWDEARWSRLTGQPGTVARNAELAAMLGKLAATDPTRAMKLAQAEGNLLLRDGLVQAVLRGWAGVAPETAADWVLAMPDADRRSDMMKAVFAGVADQPGAAQRLGAELFQKNPGDVAGYGSALIDALDGSGNFEAAAKIAADGGNSGPVQQSILLAEAYQNWAKLQPAQAAAAALALTDPAARTNALHGIVSGWSQADPAGLTQFLVQLPAGQDRDLMIGQSLQAWAQADPAAATNWIAHNDVGADADDGVAAVAGAGSLKPDEAATSAESITNPALRSQTLLNVLRNWARTDPAAAEQYFKASANLLPADRRQAANLFGPAPGP